MSVFEVIIAGGVILNVIVFLWGVFNLAKAIGNRNNDKDVGL